MESVPGGACIVWSGGTAIEPREDVVRRMSMTGQVESWICIIDDDDDLRATIKHLLEDAGLHAAAFSRGADALKFAMQGRAALFVVDIVMPEQEGLEFVRNIRARDEVTPILAMTGYDSRYLEIARMFGANEVLKKPFAGRQLLEAVQKLLEKGAASR